MVFDDKFGILIINLANVIYILYGSYILIKILSKVNLYVPIYLMKVHV